MAMRGRSKRGSGIGLRQGSYVPKLTDCHKKELTISFATHLRGRAAQQKPLGSRELVLETLGFVALQLLASHMEV